MFIIILVLYYNVIMLIIIVLHYLLYIIYITSLVPLPLRQVPPPAAAVCPSLRAQGGHKYESLRRRNPSGLPAGPLVLRTGMFPPVPWPQEASQLFFRLGLSYHFTSTLMADGDRPGWFGRRKPSHIPNHTHRKNCFASKVTYSLFFGFEYVPIPQCPCGIR